MKSTYVSPQTEIYHMSASNFMNNTSLVIVDRQTGGDDGQGGYNPDNSLARGEQSSDVWESEW